MLSQTQPTVIQNHINTDWRTLRFIVQGAHLTLPTNWDHTFSGCFSFEFPLDKFHPFLYSSLSQGSSSIHIVSSLFLILSLLSFSALLNLFRTPLYSELPRVLSDHKICQLHGSITGATWKIDCLSKQGTRTTWRVSSSMSWPIHSVRLA